jgi:hypothetical protein
MMLQPHRAAMPRFTMRVFYAAANAAGISVHILPVKVSYVARRGRKRVIILSNKLKGRVLTLAAQRMLRSSFSP